MSELCPASPPLNTRCTGTSKEELNSFDTKKKTFVAAVDGSAQSYKAFRYAKALMKEGDRLFVVRLL